MDLLRFVSCAGGGLGMAALAWCAAHVFLPVGSPPEARVFWALLGLLNFGPSGGIFVARALKRTPTRRADLFLGWAATAAPVLLLDGLVLVLGQVVR
jgi:hypothetical protein